MDDKEVKVLIDGEIKKFQIKNKSHRINSMTFIFIQQF